jgi:hypothetical protein
MLYYLTIIVILFSIILLPFFQFSKRKNSVLNSNNLILLFFIGGIYELIFTMLLGYDSQIWFKIYSYLEFLTLLLFFRKLIGITQSVFYFIIILYSIIYTFLAVMFFNKININMFELFIPIANCLLVFTGSTKWTIQQFEKLETSSLLHFPVFYILSGMILYYSGTFFIFGLETIFRYTKSPVLLYFWYINLLLLFIYRLSFYIAIWKAKKV